MSSSLDVSRPQVISDRREIGQAGCFRFFECFIDDRSAAIAQEAVDRSVSALAVRRLAREVDIAPYFRDRTVAPFASLSQARALAVWNDNGLRPAIQRARALPGGAADLLAVFIRVGEAAIDLHSVGLVHGALFPFGVWTDAGFGSVRFADCSLAFAIKDQIPLTAPWGLASDLDRARLAPEQVGDVSSLPDERTDCYGLGLVFRSILDKGQEPHYRTPEALMQLVDAMTAPEPSARPASIIAVVQTLRQIRNSLSDRMRIPEARRTLAVGEQPWKLKIRSAGRDNDLHELRRIWAEPHGKAIAIVGPPGIGKTELSRLFSDDLALSGIMVAAGKGDLLRRAQALLIVRQIVRGLWAQVVLRGPEEAARIGEIARTTLGSDADSLLAAVPEALPILNLREQPKRIGSALDQRRLGVAINGLLCGVARACGGLCIIFDDVQWLDENSLRAIEPLIANVAGAPVMLILIVRATPEAAPPPIVSGLRRIDLGPMRSTGIAAILGRTFDQRLEDADELAVQLHTLSGGNPLYVTQILHLMATEGGIIWDAPADRWRWSSGAGEERVIGDDVLGFIAERVATLQPELRRALRSAAGLAETFDAGELGIVLDRSSAEVDASLDGLAALGLIRSTEGDGEAKRWRFVHDQVRAATIRDVPQSEQSALKRAIGLKLLSQRDGASLHKHDFIISDCLWGWEAEEFDSPARQNLAKCEILVGVDARHRLDFAEATRHLERAAKLLPAEPWRNARDQWTRITEERIYCAFARNEAEVVKRLFREALDNSPDSLDAVYFYRLQTVIETQGEDYAAALRAAAKGLSKLGVRMPVSRSSAIAATTVELVRVTWRLGRDPMARLRSIRASDDPVNKATVDLIASVLVAAYFVAPELMLAGGLKILSLSLRSGRTRSTPIGEALYALGISAFFGARTAGFRLGELARQNAAADGDAYIENQVLLIHAAFVRFWRGSLTDDEPLLRRGYELARQCGDMLFANFHILGLMSHGLACGAPLAELDDLIRWGEDLISRSRDRYSLDTIEKWRDVVGALRRPAGFPAEIPPTLKPESGGRSGNLISECYRRAMLCQYLYFAGDAVGAAAAGRAAEQIMWRSPAHLIELEHAFFYGLALATAARQPKAPSWRVGLALTRMVRRLGRWAVHGSDSISARLALLRAEQASLKGNTSAIRLYEGAIRQAHGSRMPHIAALASEAAARHFLRLGPQAAAETYLLKARDLYRGWGALAKVFALESEFPELLRSSNDAEIVAPASGAVDFAGSALLAASGPRDLLPNFLTLVDRVSKADLAVYASHENHSITIDAEIRGFNEPTTPGLPPDLVNSASPSILRYVAATGAGLWGDLAADRRFGNCTRLAARRPAATCCLPVQRNDKVFGLLYLEHSSNPDAFSLSVLSALRNLTSSLAATLQNEQIDRALRARNAELADAARKIALLEAAKAQLEKFTPNVVRREIASNPTAPNLEAQPQDITVLFLDIAGYTSLNERLRPEEARTLVEGCFSRLLDPIYRHNGEICESAGDGLMVLFCASDPVDHALEAIRSAREMKQELAAMMIAVGRDEPRLVVNFGLNSGQGAVGLTRLEGKRHSRWIYSVHGQVVNIAARIVKHAREGGILIGPETARRVHGHVDMASVGYHSLKGLSAEVELFSTE